MNENQNFLDTRTIVALVLVGLVWLVWQNHLERKYPNAFKPQTQSASETPAPTLPAPQTGASTPSQPALAAAATPQMAPEKTLSFEDEQWRFELSSQGMALKNLVLKKYTDRANKPFPMGAPTAALFQTQIKNGENLNFAVSAVSPTEFRGVAHYQGAEIVKTLRVRSDNYTIDTEVEVNHAPADFPGVSVSFAEFVPDSKGGGMFAPSTEKTEAYIAHGTSEDRETFKPDESTQFSFNEVSLVGMGSHYFVLAFLDRSSILPTVVLKSSDHLATSTISYAPLNNNPTMKLTYQTYMGPKSLNLLKAVDERMPRMINFGMFSWIARPLLGLMRWIFEMVGNWGVSIIALTLLARMIVLPINIFSFRSMKAMQAIQPQMKSLREKHKEDPKALNAEMMLLMKEHKVNPLGGCLPMLLQLPVFLALYAVLGQSIELYKAPFAFWIHDLSLRDPFYVLPVMMGASMFLQQKLTPSTMDPAQAKVMMFMPIVFSFLMFSLPSGLTLYIFVSTLFGIAQQFIFMRDRATVNPPAQLKRA